MKKKILPVVIAIVLIIVIAGASFGTTLWEKYSYSKERADLADYFKMVGETDVAIVLQDEIIEERARLLDGTYYLDLDSVHKYFNTRFYEDRGEGLLLYTVPDDLISTVPGRREVPDKAGSRTMD